MKKTAITITLAMLAGLSACGGSAPEVAESARASVTRFGTPLLDDEGLAMPTDPNALPADPALRMQAVRYASIAQASQLERALGDRAVHVEVDDGAEAATALALGRVYGAQAGHGLSKSAPVLLYARDVRLANEVAQRMAEVGLSGVWVVTQ